MPKNSVEKKPVTYSYFGAGNPEIDDETTAKILGYLNTTTLVTRASLVSKQWHNLINTKFDDPIYLDKLYQTKLEKMPAFQDKPRDILNSKKLTGGMTNTTLFFKTSKGDFVARRPGKQSEHFIDRTCESINARIASDAGINAKIVLSETDGTQVTEYLTNPITMSVESFKNPAIIEKAMTALKTIHQCGLIFANEIDVFTRNKSMLKILEQQHETLTPNYIDLGKRIDAIEQIIHTISIQKVPCHNDTTTNNFILSNNEMKLIDWEYSGNNDPIWDLACLSIEGEFSQQQDTHMFHSYFKDDNNEAYQRFILYKPVVEYWVCLWSLVQVCHKNYTDSPDGLLQMEQRQLKNCLRILDSDDFAEALRCLNVTTAWARLSSR